MIKVNDSLVEIQQKQQKADFNFIIFLLVAVFLLFSITEINNNYLKSVYVSGPSMMSTLHNEDVLFMDVNAKSQNGNIIVIKDEKPNGAWIIKRQIAVGEKDRTVTVQIKDGKVYVDGKIIEEPYLEPGLRTEHYGKSYWELKENEIFYLGDNRNDSSDSRREYDTCTRDQVVGVVHDWALDIRWLSKGLYNLGEYFRNIFKSK
ncbi:MAG: signal peptidase I [Clostridiales bacterium]|nr:signal peptidase I [Clostridiales bacterium]